MLPYFKLKLHSIYNKEREARLQASLWGNEDGRFDNLEYFDGVEDSVVSSSTSDADLTTRTRLKKKIQKIVGACFPWIHASTEGLLLPCVILQVIKMFSL